MFLMLGRVRSIEGWRKGVYDIESESSTYGRSSLGSPGL